MRGQLDGTMPHGAGGRVLLTACSAHAHVQRRVGHAAWGCLPPVASDSTGGVIRGLRSSPLLQICTRFSACPMPDGSFNFLLVRQTSTSKILNFSAHNFFFEDSWQNHVANVDHGCMHAPPTSHNRLWHRAHKTMAVRIHPNKRPIAVRNIHSLWRSGSVPGP